MARLPSLRKLRDPAAREAVTKLGEHQEEARRAHRWVGAAGDSRARATGSNETWVPHQRAVPAGTAAAQPPNPPPCPPHPCAALLARLPAARRGIFEFGDPGDSDEEQEYAPRKPAARGGRR
jgi:hypothetical protein